MARMPQIPGVEYGARPGGQDARGGELPIDGGEKSLAVGADALEAYADVRQKIADKKNDVVTEVSAIKAGSDYSLTVGDTSAAYKRKYADTPFDPKLRADFEGALDQQAEVAAAAIPDEGTRYKALTRLATVNARAASEMQDWVDRQSTIKTNSTAVQLEHQGVGDAANAPSPQALERMLPTIKSDLGKVYSLTSDNPAKAIQATREKMATTWAETNSAQPNGAFAVLAALSDPNGVLQRTLKDKPGAIDSLTKKATASFVGGGVTAQVNALAAAHKDISNVLGLAVANDPKFMSASIAVRGKIQQDIEATTANTDHIPADARKARLQTLTTNAQIIDVLDNLYRSHPGVFQSKVDAKVTGDIIARSREPWLKANASGVGDHLKDMLELRRDAAAALQKGTLARAAYETVEAKLQIALPKSQAAQDTGSAVHIGNVDIGFVSPIQAGNRRMQELLGTKGAFGALTPDQRNDAWLKYYAKLNAIHQGKDGAGSASKEAMRQAALDAATEAAGAK